MWDGELSDYEYIINAVSSQIETHTLHPDNW